MAAQVLQINFRFKVSRADYEAFVAPLADAYAAIPGCIWKVWLMSEASSEAGGIYLFSDAASVEAFTSGALAKAAANHPALADFSVKQFEVLPELSRITHAPLPTPASA